NITILINMIVVLIGLFANLLILEPIYAIEKIIIDLPKITARKNCNLLTFEIPATTLITDEGENGKHNKINKRTNPLSSTQLVTFKTVLLLLILLNIFLLPSLRIIKKTAIEPRVLPIHE